MKKKGKMKTLDLEFLLVLLSLILVIFGIILTIRNPSLSEPHFKITKEGIEVNEIKYDCRIKCEGESEFRDTTDCSVREGCKTLYLGKSIKNLSIEWLDENCEILEQECELVFKAKKQNDAKVFGGTYEGYIKIENGEAYYCPKNENCWEEECKITKYQCNDYVVEILR